MKNTVCSKNDNNREPRSSPKRDAKDVSTKRVKRFTRHSFLQSSLFIVCYSSWKDIQVCNSSFLGVMLLSSDA